MNKLIIVGNGFDIHNGLASRYSDFLIWYLNKSFKSAFARYYEDTSIDASFILEDGLIDITARRIYSGSIFMDINQIEDVTKWFLGPKDRAISKYCFLYQGTMFQFDVAIHSNLFNDLLSGQIDRNWVDIEMTYYKLLKRCLTKYTTTTNKDDYSEDELLKINGDLDAIRRNLEEYLSEIRKGHIVGYDFDYCAESTIDKRIIIDQHHLKDLKDSDYEDDSCKYIIPKDITILNFNYTGLPYGLKRRAYNHIDIHGVLRSIKNQPIFGFGDEVDTDYHEMEKTNLNFLSISYKVIRILQKFKLP